MLSDERYRRRDHLVGARWFRWLLIPTLAVIVPALFTQAWAFPDTSFLDPAGPVAAAQRHHIIWVTLITLIVVLPAILLTPYLAWRYRHGARKPAYRPKWEFSWSLELLIWGVPAVIVVILGIGLWQATEQLDPYKPLASTEKPLRIDVIGLDWKWLFVYPDQGIATVGVMAVPRGRPLALNLTTDTVMQSFFIPALGSQVYAMPGMRTRLHLLADRTGNFQGLNTQYNGTGFEHQKFVARSMTKAGFREWVRQVQNHGIALNSSSYATLRKASTRAQSFSALGTSAMPSNVLYFSGVPTHFFASILARYHGGQESSATSKPTSSSIGGHIHIATTDPAH